jgi:glucitol operon activator protein
MLPMSGWGTVIILFICAWVLQVILSFYQNRHYGQTVREMSTSHSSGYLGVGVIKKRFGIGSVIILVSDLSGKVVNAKELTGVTVFSRFKSTQKLIGRTIDQLLQTKETDDRTKAIKMAVERIVEQQKNQTVLEV